MTDRLRHFQKDGPPQYYVHTTSEGEVVRFCVKPINQYFAQICGAEPDGSESKLTSDFTLFGLEGKSARKVRGSFMIAYRDSYTLSYKKKPILKVIEVRSQIDRCGEGTKPI